MRELLENPLVEEWQTFSEYSEVFWKNFGGFKPYDEWFDRVQERHVALRGKLGAIKVSKQINLSAMQKPADKEVCYPLFLELKEVLPNLEECLSTEDGDFEPLLYPTFQIGSHRVIKTGKSIVGWVEDYHYYNSDKKEKIAQANNIISKLGQEWAKAKVSDASFAIELDTSAMAFCMLGHYGPDNDSCFRQNGENDAHKYVLGQSEGTFVILIKDQDKKVIARFWGYAFPPFSVFNVCNFYMEKGVSEGNIIEGLKTFFSDIIGSDDIHTTEGITNVGDGVYHNNYGDFTFSTDSAQSRSTDVTRLSPDMNAIWHKETCSNCGEEHENNRYFMFVDNDHVCQYCADGASYCEFSRTRTFEAIYDVYTSVNKDNNQPWEIMSVKSSLVHKFPECDICHDRFKPELIKNLDGERLCPNCFEDSSSPGG